jgi:CubicO group peptidase (beta-lactamase class C family)
MADSDRAVNTLAVATLAFVLCGTVAPVHALGANTAASNRTRQSQAVDTIVRAQMKRRGIPGAQVAVIDHDHIVFRHAYGTADIATQAPVTERTLFPINSATKAFTGVACMQLVEQGSLDLNAPISTYLDGLPDSWRAVTIRQLMTHMSGLPDIIDGSGATIEGGDEARAWTKVYSLPLQFKAGEHFSYNQTNYALLQRIVSKLTGKPFTGLIAGSQFKPSGMTATTFGDSTSLATGTAVSYHRVFPGKDGKGELDTVQEVYPEFMRSGAGIDTSADELAKWLIRVQAGAFFKTKGTLARMWTPDTLNSGMPGPRTPGWIVKRQGAHPAVGAEGGGRAAFAVYPQDGVAVIILTNLAGANPEELLDQVAANYITGFALSPIDRLRVALEAQGFDKAPGVFQTLRDKDAAFDVAEADLNRWGYRLLLSGKGDDALEVFKLVVRLHPDSGNAYDSLAGGYEALGDKTRAIANYQASLKLDPTNTNAVDRLKALAAN